MGKGGGRPRDEEVRKHFTELEGRRVKCNYCEHSFAAGGGSSRMKAHIHKLKGQGVRPCTAIVPQSNNEAKDQERIQVGPSFVSSRDNEDLQGIQYGSEHSRLDGNKGVQLHTSDEERGSRHDDLQKGPAQSASTGTFGRIMEFKDAPMFSDPNLHWESMLEWRMADPPDARDQEPIEVESSSASNWDNEDSQVIQYVLQHLRPKGNIFISPLSHLTQEEFITLIEPEAFLDSWVIDAFAEILTHIERNKKTTPSNWYLPVTFSKKLELKGDVKDFLNFVHDHKMIENYMSENLNSCEKLFAMENLFGEGTFTKFRLKMADGILLQPNGFDCGVFVINFMEQSDNYVKRNPLFQYDSQKEREDLALELLKSDLNQEKQNLYYKARRHCPQDEKKYGNKRLRPGTSDDERRNKHDDLHKGSSKGYLLPTTDLIGKEFQRCTQQIWNWIMDDKVSAIGVWGMGGSGKTALDWTCQKRACMTLYMK